MDYIKIVNWKRWQSYRSDRSQPPWIKLHRCLMRNLEWLALNDAQKGQLVSLWILAAETKGKIPNNPEVLQKLCFLSKKPDLELFSSLGFIEGWRQSDAKVTPSRRQRDAKMTQSDQLRLSNCPPSDSPSDSERLRETSEGGISDPKKDPLAQIGFELFWQAYPRKTAKKDAVKAWGQLDPDKALREKILDSVAKQKYSAQWTRDNGQAIPYPASFLRGERWEDEVQQQLRSMTVEEVEARAREGKPDYDTD